MFLTGVPQTPEQGRGTGGRGGHTKFLVLPRLCFEQMDPGAAITRVMDRHVFFTAYARYGENLVSTRTRGVCV